MKYHYQRHRADDNEDKPLPIEDNELSPALPAGLGRFRADLGQILFVALVLVIGLKVSSIYNATIIERRMLTQAEAVCVERAERPGLDRLYWDKDQRLCLWRLENKKTIAER